MNDFFSSANFVYAVLTGLVSGSVVLGGFLIRVGRKIEKIESMESSHKELKTDMLVVGRKIEKIESIEASHQELKSEMIAVRDSLIGIRAGLVQAGVLKEAFLTSTSPVSLTELGLQALEESGFLRLLHDEKNKGRIFTLIDELKPHNAYEVQESATKAMYALTDDPMISGMQLYVFRQGKPLADVLHAAGIYVRDRYLEAHPDIAR